ncbi:hypothetical protein, partial [Bifidobacterium breve]|uniref:hypothetical protein n=1 Tax=Bifidobacterium breve TaxID=1685 RepID=UPI001C8EDD91
TDVVGSSCNQSTCGRHVSPVLSLQMNPELVFSIAARTAQELPNPVHYLTVLILASPLDEPSPATYLRGALHRFPMNTLLVHDLKALIKT